MQYLVKTDLGFTTIEGASIMAVKEYFLDQGVIASFVLPWPFDLNKYKKNAGLKDKECQDLFFQLSNLMRSTGSIGTSVNMLYDRLAMTQPIGFKHGSKIRNLIDKLVIQYYRDKFKKYILFLKSFKEDVSAGAELPKTLKDNRFDEVVITITKSAMGDYVKAFEKCAEFFEAKQKYKKGIMDALAYPATLFFMLYVSFFVFIFYVVPAFAKFFKQFHHLAKGTLLVINTFTFLKAYYMYYTGLFIIIVALFFYFFVMDKWGIKTKFFNALAKIPVIGTLFQYEFLRYFAYEFSILVSAGEHITNIMKFFKENTENDFYRQKIGLVYAHIVYGYSLTESLQIANFLRPQDIHFVASAETSGALDTAFMELSKTYDQLFELEVKIFKKVLTGVSMAIVIFFIIFIFGGIYLPMINGMLTMRG